MSWFSKGDRVRIKVGPCSGSFGTVRDFIGGDVWVVVDGHEGEGWLHKVTEIEGVERAKPADSIRSNKGDGGYRENPWEYSVTSTGRAKTTDSIHVDNIVNNPPHYTGFSNGAQVVDITENLPFNRGSAIKYLARAGKKNADRELEDLKKALWFVAREIERVEKSEKKEEK